MNDFKSFSDGKKADTDIQNGQIEAKNGQNVRGQGATQSGDKVSGNAQLNNTVEMAKIITRAMNGKSTAQILQTIISEAERGKREGTLTDADLDNFYNALSPVLDGAKRRKLKEVIARLKSI